LFRSSLPAVALSVSLLACAPIDPADPDGPPVEPLDIAPADVTDVPSEWGALRPPQGMAEQTAYCWFLESDFLDDDVTRLRVMGMDTGAIDTVFTWPTLYDYGHGTLAFDGRHFVVAARNGSSEIQYLVIDVRTGELEEGAFMERGHSSIMWMGDHWRAQRRYALPGVYTPLDPSAGTLRFETLDDLLAGNGTVQPGFDGATVLHSRDGEEVFGAWHSADEILVYDADTSTPLEVVSLDGYDDWFAGIATAAGEIYAMDRGNNDPAPGMGRAFLHRFTADGTLRTRFPAAEAPLDPSGPWCESL
jgi:hypothetical protein